ncbi:MAG: hypothetical protein ACI9TK_000085 [Flavobacteriaceae bacterium]|jgi:hypothetical protein|tara:strand:- start:106 stop:621 length:516 start_codon:yes stop_codon:yes gene_type:complete
MRTLFFSALALFCFSSCLVFNIFQSSEKYNDNRELTPGASSVHSKDPISLHREMIGSGKIIDLGKQGRHEILFFGKVNTPKNIFQQTDSIFSGLSKWISDENPNMKTIITKKEEDKPIIVVDGKISSNSSILKEINPDAIEIVNVLKGEAAFEKYGEKAKNGAIEIITKKN